MLKPNLAATFFWVKAALGPRAGLSQLHVHVRVACCECDRVYSLVVSAGKTLVAVSIVFSAYKVVST